MDINEHKVMGESDARIQLSIVIDTVLLFFFLNIQSNCKPRSTRLYSGHGDVVSDDVVSGEDGRMPSDDLNSQQVSGRVST